ncbi:MAG: HpyAIV family type II restriction enzyme, partial [Elusimicrobiales bacterium]
NKSIVGENGDSLSLDQYYEGKGIYYFIEQKVRDDHDSTKKRGQISNFETKLETLYKKHKDKLVGIMYFIDPDLSKNKNYYLPELKRLSEFYGVKTHLLYGKELFDYLGAPDLWNQLLSWLKHWKDNLPEIPEIDFDKTPEKSFEEIKELPIRYWRKLLEDEKLWTEGIIKAVFRSGKTLKLSLNYFEKQGIKPYTELTSLLNSLLKKYYD